MNGITTLVNHNNAVMSRLRKAKRDYPDNLNITFEQYLDLKSKEILFRYHNGFTPELFEMLNIVVRLFRESNKAVNSYIIGKMLSPSDSGKSIVMGVRHKLDRLVNRGYAERIGKSGKCILYVPTVKAIKELSELIK